MIIRKGLKPVIVGAALCGRPDEGHPQGGVPTYNHNRIILHLDLDAFFAQVEETADPTIQGKPIFVVGHSLHSGVVLTSNYEARRYGVKTGMALHEAKKLCPFAVLVPADCSKYSDTSQQIFSQLETYTPLVETFSIDEAFLDVTDTYFRWGTPEAIAREIKQWVKNRFGLTLSVGIAPNKLLAKLASGYQKPDGLFRIRPEEIEPLMKQLPIEELCGIGHRLQSHLNGMGIFTAYELGRFSDSILQERFGIIGLVLKRMGQGIDHSPVLAVDHLDEVKSIGHSYTLTHAVHDREGAFRYLSWLSEKVGRRLRRCRSEGRVIHAIIRFSSFETVSRQRNLSFFTDQGKTIFEYAKRIFSQIDHPRESIRFLGVSVSKLRPSGKESWLFEDFNKERGLTQALDAINDKYGEFTLRPAFLAFPDDKKIASRALQLFGSGRH